MSMSVTRASPAILETRFHLSQALSTNLTPQDTLTWVFLIDTFEFRFEGGLSPCNSVQAIFTG